MRFVPLLARLNSTPEPDSVLNDTGVSEVLETSLDIIGLALTSLLWILGIVAFTQITGFILRRLGNSHPLLKYLERRSRFPGSFATLTFGAALGWWWSVPAANAWFDSVQHVLLILCIIAVTWWLMSLCGVLEDMTRHRIADPQSPSRLLTQAQVLHRVLQVFFAISGVAAIALTFPSARAAMGSLLASAGIISLVAGIAAQGVLANMFAGLQIAFADSIRVGDVVVVQDTKQGTIEEITLTYVVIHMADGRRLILPSKKFTEEIFENWTKKDTKLLGAIELFVDWRLPMESFRTEVDRLLSKTDLWDGRTANVQVTDSDSQTMKVRVMVSADNSGDLWDLRCYMREHLLDWTQGVAPYALPVSRIESQETMKVALPATEIEVEKQIRQELVAEVIAQRQQRQEASTSASTTKPPSTDPYGEPLLDQYARRIQEKRRSWRLKAKQLAQDPRPVPDDSALSETKQLTTTATISTERFFSGTPDGEERRRLVSGPNGNNTTEASEETEK